MKLKASCGVIFFLVILSIQEVRSQNPLFIPPIMNGPDFQLNVEQGTKTFFAGYNTPTYGVNGNFLAPTLVFTKGDIVSLHVTNNINTTTTMHWHGLHVPAQYDGGPHQIIETGATWNISFEVMNDAATYWYHPHGAGKTDLQVSKGLAGLIIVKDSNEASLELPGNYGVDDFPLIIQSKAFDILYQIAIATDLDTVIMVNGTMNPFLDAPAQVVRFRILNGSSLRSYYFGFSNNMPFQQIATDGGLLNAPVQLTRVRLAPGERAEILVDFQAMQGETIFLENFGSELTDGIYGAADVGNGMASIPDYHLNPLNGADYNILEINITAPTVNPVTTIPSLTNAFIPLNENDAAITRTFLLEPQHMMPMSEMVEGPFTINGVQFSMDTINETTYRNATEIWKIDNQTLIAHPFHIHDVQFFILDENGGIPPPNEQGKKDMVLVMPMETASVIMKFEDYTDNVFPYMYHCHMLHHEDDGMMGSFLVRDSSTIGIEQLFNDDALHSFPNPVDKVLTVKLNLPDAELVDYSLLNAMGQKIISGSGAVGKGCVQINIERVEPGLYLLQINHDADHASQKIVKQ
jgi:bilirubin oxidase